jgi:S-adenosylmethionine:tRNA ribosyltransferase-isomerase
VPAVVDVAQSKDLLSGAAAVLRYNPAAMHRSDFHYELPPELIAQRPPAQRGDSRLLCVGPGETLADGGIRDFPAQLTHGDLLIFNDTRVIPARLFGVKSSGGRVEVLVERLLGERDLLAQVRASKSPKPGSFIVVDGAEAQLNVVGREGEFFHLKVEGYDTALNLLERFGHIPLPPYIDRGDETEDRERYQTVFARNPGAVAAPTAGLHFDEALLDAIRARGARIATLTLHVGAGTFQPVRVDDLAQHRMHAERYFIPDSLVQAVAETRAAGGRVIAIGTTSLRALEACAQATGEVTGGWSETRLFITPGYRFRVVDALLTNFHLPESTLLMLVSAFAGYERVMRAYAHAVAQQYRFFSYGDAMWLQRQ